MEEQGDYQLPSCTYKVFSLVKPFFLRFLCFFAGLASLVKGPGLFRLTTSEGDGVIKSIHPQFKSSPSLVCANSEPSYGQSLLKVCVPRCPFMTYLCKHICTVQTTWAWRYRKWSYCLLRRGCSHLLVEKLFLIDLTIGCWRMDGYVASSLGWVSVEYASRNSQNVNSAT